MFRSALVALKPEVANDVLTTYAVELALQSSLHLAGIAIVDRDIVAPPEPVPLGGMAFKQQRDAARLAAGRAQSHAVLADFIERCQAAGVSHETIACEEALGTELAHAVQCHDLLLLGHTGGTVAGGETGSHSHLPAILRRNPRPAIVTPAIARWGKNVVVAYDGSVQAARAIAAFVGSGFERETEVHVVSYGADLATAREVASWAAAFLKRHGFSVVTHAGVESGAAVAERILAHCGQLEAKLLVMGACSKSTLWEFVFGSVTQRLLAEATFPILLDH